MIVGTTIQRLDGNTYYSPEFPRGGLAATFVVDVTQLVLSSGSITVIVEHRNNEDTTWSTAGTFTAITAVGAASLDVTGLKEVVRLAFGFVTTTTTTDAAHFLVQAPTWRPY